MDIQTIYCLPFSDYTIHVMGPLYHLTCMVRSWVELASNVLHMAVTFSWFQNSVENEVVLFDK